MSTGSPMSTFPWKRTPFVVLRSRTSRQTMMRFESMGSASLLGGTEETRDDAEPDGAALLRVELQREDRSSADDRRKLDAAVGRGPENDRLVLGHDVIAVDEVELASGGNVRERRVIRDDPNLVPTHVRDLSPHARRELETFDASGKEAQAGSPAILVASVEDHLAADADREKRHLPPGDIAKGIVEPVTREARHGCPRRPDSRKDHTAGSPDDLGIASDLRGEPKMPDGVRDARQVAGVVV